MKKEDFIVNTPIITIPKETQPEKLFILGKEFDCSNIEELLDKVLEAVVVLHNNNATPLFPKEVKIK